MIFIFDVNKEYYVGVNLIDKFLFLEIYLGLGCYFLDFDCFC